MRIEFPVPEQLPALRSLWQEAFGDSEEFLDSFFSTAFSPERCRCLYVDGGVAAALYWFDCQCRGKTMAYLYAVATGKKYRRQGFCRELLENTHMHLANRGYAGAILVPGSETLTAMYAGMGYRSGTTVSEFVCAPGPNPISLHRIDSEEYAQRRAKLLPPDGVVQEGENLLFLQTQARLYEGMGFLLAAQIRGDTLHGLELLGDPTVAPGILRALGMISGSFRAPGSMLPFAMYRSFGSDCPIPAYFGLAFD